MRLSAPVGAAPSGCLLLPVGTYSSIDLDSAEQPDSRPLQLRYAMSPCVVVIEDEPEVLELLCDVLGSSGFSTVGLRDPEQLHGMPDSMRPDLFLVDLMLPGKSGIEVAKELREEGYADTPMVAISASRLMLRTALKSELFQATLHKPFDVMNVIDTVEHCMV